MVKVLLLKQLFDGQQIVGLDDEPVEISTSSNELFLVATKGGNVKNRGATKAQRHHICVFGSRGREDPPRPVVFFPDGEFYDCGVGLPS